MRGTNAMNREVKGFTLLTVEEAARCLSIGRTTMFALLRAREIESVQIGRLRRVHVSALVAYAARLASEQSPAVA